MHKIIVLLNDKTIIELDFAKYRDLSVSRRSIICLCLRHRQITDLLATDKSRYFAQPRPIIVYYYYYYYYLYNLYNAFSEEIQKRFTCNQIFKKN